MTNFKRPPKELVGEFRRLFTGCVSDAMNKGGAMCSAIKPLIEQVKVAGPALTVWTYPGDITTLVKAIDIAQKGDILVVDGRGFTEAAIWGELLTRSAILRGIEAVIIDGAVRDTTDIRKLRYPVFARAAVPCDGTMGFLGNINVPIQCGGIQVNPGDVVLGDDDGVVVVPQGQAKEVLEYAKNIAEAEVKIKDLIEKGKTVGEILNIDKVLEELAKKKPAQLEVK
ncbi:RraA family protein [Candidatus Bathyarchaeota archaeon]|nr:RraA family protein [Candidatus Bathyarchaeota archaeon]